MLGTPCMMYQGTRVYGARLSSTWYTYVSDKVRCRLYGAHMKGEGWLMSLMKLSHSEVLDEFWKLLA